MRDKEQQRQGVGRRRALRRWFLLVLVALVGSEAVAALAISIVNPRLDTPILRRSEIFRRQSQGILELIEAHENGGRVMLDRRLGYRFRPDHTAPAHRINAQGVRALGEYSSTPPAGALRVAAFGDSFVYALEVGAADSWARLIETAYPRIEVLNYGVGGYGTAQAYLRFLAEGRALAPSVVIIGFTPVMLRRTVNRFRPFLGTTFNPLVKPRYRLLDDDSLELVPAPITAVSEYRRYLDEPARIIELAEHDGTYRPSVYESRWHDLSATARLLNGLRIKVDNRYFDAKRLRTGVFDDRSEAFRVQIALLAAFADAVRAAGMAPLVVIFPDDRAFARDRAGYPPPYAPLVAALAERGVEHLDLMAAFRAVDPSPPIDDWFTPGRHYSPAANRVAGARIGRELVARFGSEIAAR